MERIIAGRTKERQPVVWKFNYVDLIIAISSALLFGGLAILFINLKLHWAVAVVLPIVLMLICWTSLIKVGEDRLYTYYVYLFNYFFRKKKIPASTLKKACGVNFFDDYVKAEEYSRIIEVQGINLDLLPEKEQDMRIDYFGMCLNALKDGKILRMDKRVSFKTLIKETEERIDYYANKIKTEKDKEKVEQMKRKLDSLKIDLDIYALKDGEDPIYMDAYYIIVYANSMENLNTNTDEVVTTFTRLGMAPHVLDKEELKKFYENFYVEHVDEKGDMPFPAITEHKGTIEFGNKNLKIASISHLPFSEFNAFMAPLFNIPDTNIVVNFRKDDNIDKVNKRLNRTISSIGADLMNAKSESDKMKLQNKRDAFYQMSAELNNGMNTSNLFNVEIYIMFVNNKKTMKTVNNIIRKTMRARLDYLSFRQYPAFSAMLPHYSGKKFVEIQRDMVTSTLAGAFPFYSDKFFEDNGDIIGTTGSGVPVCFDMWYNLNNKKAETRTNANLTILGASGKGKSYFMKLMLLNELKKNTKIFILDPENEYEYIAKAFNGQTIDVAGGKIRINPFEIFPDIDESGNIMSVKGNMLGKHLPFLVDFFKITLPYLSNYARQVLERLVSDTYKSKNIRNSTDISKLKTEDFPTFQDLIAVAEKQRKRKDLQNMELEAIIEICDSLSKFDKENMYGELWNGYTTLSLNNEFTTFNFRALDSSSSTEVRNAQMLLITKFLNREVVKNYELQFKSKEKKTKRILLIVDEAHVFIDPNFPVALDLMKNMTKRIRKYNGSFWVATQNIADFIGFDTNTKTKATAVLNNCQYTALFGLKPNDMEQVREMYAKSEAGAFTEEEVSYLQTASQGDCLLLIDQTHRISFHTALKDTEKETHFILQPRPTEKKEEEVQEEPEVVPTQIKKEEKKNEKQA